MYGFVCAHVCECMNVHVCAFAYVDMCVHMCVSVEGNTSHQWDFSSLSLHRIYSRDLLSQHWGYRHTTIPTSYMDTELRPHTWAISFATK